MSQESPPSAREQTTPKQWMADLDARLKGVEKLLNDGLDIGKKTLTEQPDIRERLDTLEQRVHNIRMSADSGQHHLHLTTIEIRSTRSGLQRLTGCIDDLQRTVSRLEAEQLQLQGEHSEAQRKRVEAEKNARRLRGQLDHCKAELGQQRRFQDDVREGMDDMDARFREQQDVLSGELAALKAKMERWKEKTRILRHERDALKRELEERTPPGQKPQPGPRAQGVPAPGGVKQGNPSAAGGARGQADSRNGEATPRPSRPGPHVKQQPTPMATPVYSAQPIHKPGGGKGMADAAFPDTPLNPRGLATGSTTFSEFPISGIHVESGISPASVPGHPGVAPRSSASSSDEETARRMAELHQELQADMTRGADRLARKAQDKGADPSNLRSFTRPLGTPVTYKEIPLKDHGGGRPGARAGPSYAGSGSPEPVGPPPSPEDDFWMKIMRSRE